MDFSLITMFVLPPSNVFPNNIPTESLAPGQFGIYGAGYQIAQATDPYIYLVQGRKENVDNTGSKRSAKISRDKIISYYKVPSEPQTTNQRTEINNFQVKCGEEMVITIRAHSNYIDLGFANGYTQSVVVPAPCCNCGSDPCTSIDPVDIDRMLDDAIQKFSVSGPFMGSVLSNYVTVSREGTGIDAKLVIEGKPLAPDGRLVSDLSANPWEYDRLWYRVFVTKAADTTQDYLTYDRCEQLATVNTIDQYGYTRGSADEIFHMEKYYYSYQTPHFKTLHCNPGWNGAFESYVVDGLDYDLFYIKFHDYDWTYTWDNTLPQDQTVIIAIPAGQSAEFESRMTTCMQGMAFTNFGGAPRTTTPPSSTGTSSTNTTSTTQS